MPNAGNINPNEEEISHSKETQLLTDNRKLNARKPKAAGNLSFRKHNKLRFMKTLERRHVGLRNKL